MVKSYLLLKSSEMIQSRTTAPITAVMSVPNQLSPKLIPSQLNRLPPMKPPATPISRLNKKPKLQNKKQNYLSIEKK
jgi:hypothetical protein